MLWRLNLNFHPHSESHVLVLKWENHTLSCQEEAEEEEYGEEYIIKLPLTVLWGIGAISARLTTRSFEIPKR